MATTEERLTRIENALNLDLQDRAKVGRATDAEIAAVGRSNPIAAAVATVTQQTASSNSRTVNLRRSRRVANDMTASG